MLENTAIKIAASKLVNTPLLHGSVMLIGGIVIWQLWSKQEQLQTITCKLSNELKEVKKQIAEIKGTNNDESATPLSSSFKKFFNF